MRKSSCAKQLLLASLLIASTSGVAQKLNLSQAVDYAKARNLNIQKSYSYQEASREAKEGTETYYLPTVSVYGGYTHLSDELTLDLSQVQTSFVDGLSRQQVSTLNTVSEEINGVPLTDQQKIDIYNNSSNTLNALYPNFDARLAYQDYFMASVFVNQPIYLGGKLSNTHQIEESNYRIAQYSNFQAHDMVTRQTIEQYLTLLLLKQVVKTRESTYRGMVKHDSSTIRLVEAEIIPQFYEYGAQAAVAGSESRWVTASNEYQAALNLFKNHLNMPLDTVIDLSDSLYFVDFSFDVNEAQEASIAYSPLIKINEESQNIAESNISLARSEYLPDVFAVGEVQLYQQNLPVITPPWMVSLQLKWDIFNGGRDVNNVKAAKLFKEASKYDEELISNELTTQVKNANNRIETSKAVYVNQIKTRRLSQKNYHSIQKQYAHGRVRSNEVIDARTLFEEAQLAELEALYLYYLSVIELHSLKGDLNTFVQIYEAAN